MSAEPHIVIIGGGFSGAAVAIELLRLAPNGVRVTLLEPRQSPGAGVAYSTAEPTHRINVPAARMQLAGDEEGAFDHWYRHQPAFAVDAQALLRRIRDVEADLTQALTQVALLIVAGPGCPCAAKVAARQQAMARKGDDTAAVAQPVQRRDRIGHG